MGRGILRGAGGDENLKSNFIWPYLCDFLSNEIVICITAVARSFLGPILYPKHISDIKVTMFKNFYLVAICSKV